MTAMLDPQSVALFLEDHPHFFDEHPDLVLQLKLTSPLGGRTLSLQERQVEVLREKVKLLELKLANLTRVASSNNAIVEKLHQWMRRLLLCREDHDLPDAMLQALLLEFNIPSASLRIWHSTSKIPKTWLIGDESQSVRKFVDQMVQPYCGPANNQPGLRWLNNADTMQSVALVALRSVDTQQSFGLLVLGSPDPQRFSTDMATDYLARIGEIASAGLQGSFDSTASGE